MITHTTAFENLAKAPVKQTDIIVAKQTLTDTGYIDATPTWKSSDLLMQVNIDSVGEMLGTATKKATVGLLGIVSNVKSGDVFQVRFGMYATSAYTYISEGFYIVDTVDFNYESGSTTVTMYDHIWTASKTLYSDVTSLSSITYPTTVQGLATAVASLLGVTLMSGFSSLPNAAYAITADLYATISGVTLQNVLQDLAGATGTTVRVTDTTLNFSQYSVSSETLDSSTLKSLKIGDTYGPVTSIILGRVPQNDNVAIYAVPPFTSTVTAVNTTTNLLTIPSNNMINGNMVQIASTATIPAPLQANTNYYVYTGGNTSTFALALTYSDAIAGTNLIDLTTSGTGTITIPTLVSKEIQINNNQIVDSNRATALPTLYNKLSGIYWSDVKSDTIGLGWHEVGDVILFNQGTVTVRAFLNEVHLTFAASVKESLSSSIPKVAAIDYKTAGGVLKSIYNTEIRVDKQDNEITSIVSRQDQVDDTITNNYTQITQNVSDINLTVQKSGGGNLLLNSVGYAQEQLTDTSAVNYPRLVSWTYPTNYNVATNGAVTSYDSSESQNYGGISGRVIQMSSDYLTGKTVTLTQQVKVAVNTPMCFGMLVRNDLNKGGATITLSNTNNTFTLVIPTTSTFTWEEKSILDFVTTLPWLDVSIQASAENFRFSDLRLLYGTSLRGWVQSNNEVLSANVQFNNNGMRIFDSAHNTETNVTYNRFSTVRRTDGVTLFAADDTGIITNDIKQNGSQTYYSAGLGVIKQITIPISSTKAGIAFIKVT